jgi:penicillin-binding protein 2
LAKSNTYYEAGELIGKDGIEKQYEDYLRGSKGKKIFNRNNLNKITGSFKNGEQDTLAKRGKDLTLTLDIELQQYAQKLMTGKRGGIVAIEPSTGEILALVTAPSYNPNMLVGRKRSKNSAILMDPKSLEKPTYDRGLKASYPPSTRTKELKTACKVS